MSSWDQTNRGEKLGWRNRKKISKLSMVTVAYGSSSELFYGSHPGEEAQSLEKEPRIIII
jgi:hypothetical protein